MLKQYDIVSELRNVKNVDMFWFGVWYYNENLAGYFEDVKKEKSSALKAQDDIAKSAYMSNPYYSSLEVVRDSSIMKIVGNLSTDLITKDFAKQASISVVEDEETNAFALPDGRLYINTGLLSVDSLTYAGLLGVCAHEMAHFVLQHAAIRCYKEEKRLKKNKIAAGIVAGVNVAAAGYAAAQGVETDWDNVNKTTMDLEKWVFDNASKYKYKYSREQEIEADIIAFRFFGMYWI